MVSSEGGFLQIEGVLGILEFLESTDVLIRGEGFLQETSASVPLEIEAGQPMTAGLQSDQGSRELPAIPGFDAFEISPTAGEPLSKKMSEINTQVYSASTRT